MTSLTSGELWVRCPNCTRRLAKRVKPGHFQVSHRVSSTSRSTVEVVLGSITCPRCSYVLNVLGIPDASYEEVKTDGKH